MDRPVTPRETARAITRVERGATVDRREAEALLAARGEDLDRLVAVAGRIRDAGLLEAGRPRVLTYSPKVFIPLTRLCRDHCHYCTFATDPASLRREGSEEYLSLDEVVSLAEAGADSGCAEALFTLGDTPESRWPQARAWLEEAGYADTVSYLRAAAIHVIEATGLLPHLNPGVLGWADLRRLRPVAPSMGLMLESSARRLFETPGEVHYGSPDKDPAVRRRVLTDAGRLAIPFTTGVLAGIGETAAEFIDSVLTIRSVAREFGHVQEVLVQNFRSKPDTAARARPDLSAAEYLAAVATARVLLGPGMRLQVPPNLTEPADFRRLVAAGADDLGGISPVTPDHVNPERPWPMVSALRELVAADGWDLAPRLTVHPHYVRAADSWIDPRLHPHVGALADGSGMARSPIAPKGAPWQAEDPGYDEFARGAAGGRVDLATAIDLTGRRTSTRGDVESVYGDWTAVGERVPATSVPSALPSDTAAGLRLAADDPAALADSRNAHLAVSLMSAEGEALDLLCRLADDVRQDTVGDTVTFVVNRNLNFTNVCYTGCRFCAFAQREQDADAFTLSLHEVGDRVDEAASAGATEVCMQGGIHPALPGSAYFDLAAEVKKRQPGMHLHAFSPMEIMNGSARSALPIAEWLQRAMAAGVDSIPGTAAEILDDEVRWVLTKGKLPASEWIEVVTTAHELGLPSSATMMYGHVDRPDHWVGHLRTIRGIQERTGGFTEFVPLPFVHQQSPIYLAGVARPGPSVRDNRAVHAMARLMLHGAIDHIQCSWVKLGPAGCAVMLAGGADDLGGTLMEETISRMAGSSFGSAMSAAQLMEVAAAAGRPGAQRTTLYSPVESPLAAAPGPAPAASNGAEPVDDAPVLTQDVP